MTPAWARLLVVALVFVGLIVAFANGAFLWFALGFVILLVMGLFVVSVATLVRGQRQ